MGPGWYKIINHHSSIKHFLWTSIKNQFPQNHKHCCLTVNMNVPTSTTRSLSISVIAWCNLKEIYIALRYAVVFRCNSNHYGVDYRWKSVLKDDVIDLSSRVYFPFILTLNRHMFVCELEVVPMCTKPAHTCDRKICQYFPFKFLNVENREWANDTLRKKHERKRSKFDQCWGT